MCTQVYYLPIQTFYNQVTLPTMLTSMPLIRDVIIREGITILHGHGVRNIYQTVPSLATLVVKEIIIMSTFHM